MSFMQPQVYEGDYFEVDTSLGTEIVPAAGLGGLTDAAGVDMLCDFLEGEPDDPEDLVSVQHGWLARMSAPGYMDCTEWTVHDTEWEARKYLDETYREDEVEYHPMPAHWASALINADETGLEPHEARELHRYLKANPEYGQPVDVGPEELRNWNGLLTEVCDYVFLRRT